LSKTQDFQLKSETGSLRTRAKVKSYQLLSKEEEGGLMKVSLQVELSEDAQTCGQPGAAAYQPRVLVLPFSIDRPSQAYDLYGLPEGLALQLARHLESSSFVAQTLASDGRGVLGLDEKTRDVQSLARDTGAQFVILGVVRDASMRVEQSPANRFAEDFWRWTGRPTATFNDPNQRNLALEVFLYDGHTGQKLASELKGAGWTGWVEMDRNTPVGSPAFMRSPMGRTLNQIYSAILTPMTQQMACAPFVTRVVAKEGELGVVDAGSLQGLKVGDRLLSYRASGFTLRAGARNLGQIEKPVGVLEIQSVQGDFSLAKALDQGVEIQMGDILKNF
jgi:TolB-like protein